MRSKRSRLSWTSALVKVLKATPKVIKYLVMHSPLPANPNMRAAMRYLMKIQELAVQAMHQRYGG